MTLAETLQELIRLTEQRRALNQNYEKLRENLHQEGFSLIWEELDEQYVLHPGVIARYSQRDSQRAKQEAQDQEEESFLSEEDEDAFFATGIKFV